MHYTLRQYNEAQLVFRVAAEQTETEVDKARSILNAALISRYFNLELGIEEINKNILENSLYYSLSPLMQTNVDSVLNVYFYSKNRH